MVFNAMVTNDDDHPRNHPLLHTRGGWRLSPAYDILPVPMVSVERRDVALEVGRFGRAASLYNLLSQCEAFGLGVQESRASIDAMLAAAAPCFFREAPPEALQSSIWEAQTYG